MRKLNERELALRQEFEEHVSKGIKKSTLFREMYKKQNLTIAEIAKITDCHYSFVYGVISSSYEIEKKSETSKSDIIRSLVDEGKTVGQIAKELNSNYSFVFSVVKKYKESKAAK